MQPCYNHFNQKLNATAKVHERNTSEVTMSTKQNIIKAVLFDLDGTLIDTAPDFIRIIKDMCLEQGVACPSDAQIREQVSAGSRAMVSLISQMAGTNATDEVLEAQRQQFLSSYEKNICVDTQIYAGFEAILQKLEKQGIPWGIVTNKPRNLSESLLKALNLTERCQVLVCPEDVTNPKPDPEALFLAARTLNITPEHIIYIGDHPRDITAGNDANMQTVLAKYGYLPPKPDGSTNYALSELQAWGADEMVNDAHDLFTLLWQKKQLMNNAYTQSTEQSHANIRNFEITVNCLEGKNILVTGAGDGIGRAVALTYAKLGATVLLLGKTTSKLEAVYDEIESSGGAQPALIPMNLESASYTDMQKLELLIEEEMGVLHGILHNAAILGSLTPLANYDNDMFEQVMRINCQSNFMLTQILMPLLKKAKNASVIFTTSSVGHKPRALWGAYALSKMAVEGMCQIFTHESQEGENSHIRFNCINPGATRTQMRASAYPSENPNTLKTPDDIMAGYVCLMADASVDVRGQVIDLQPK